jgi:hypothetical protein
MSARITVDLLAVYPVFDGVAHRAWLIEFPKPGDMITTLCGRTDFAEFVDGPVAEPAVPPCSGCEMEYRMPGRGPMLTYAPAALRVPEARWVRRPQPHPR